MAVKAVRREASGPNKRSTLMKHLVKRESWTTALRLTEQREKGSLKARNTTDKKELLILAPGDACRWEMLKLMKMMMGEN
jgi:hypothetical protein